MFPNVFKRICLEFWGENFLNILMELYRNFWEKFSWIDVRILHNLWKDFWNKFSRQFLGIKFGIFRRNSSKILEKSHRVSGKYSPVFLKENLWIYFDIFNASCKRHSPKYLGEILRNFWGKFYAISSGDSS